MKRILLIDDDEKIASLLSMYLMDFEMELEAYQDPFAGLEALQSDDADLVLLDIMMPGIDGLEVCRRIRTFSEVPIIMLTARGEVTDRIVGLELGADDYLPKPFVPRELVVRIQTVLKRSHHQPRSAAAKMTFGDLVVDLDRRTAYLHEEDLELTSMEFETLKMLSEAPGKAFSRDEILNNLRGFEADVFSRAVDITISRLRTKLQDDSKNPTYIKTVWGVGYVFLRSSSQS